MNLTFTQLQKINELHQTLFALKSFITGLKQLMAQLMEHHCDCNFTFDIHNLHQHQQNEYAKAAFTQGIEDYIRNGPPSSIPGTEACHQKLLFSFSESESLTILNLVIQLKETKAAALQQQIENILLRTMKIELTELPANPIQQLYHGSQ